MFNKNLTVTTAEQVSYKGMDSFFQVGKITFMQLSALRSLRTIINLHRSWVDNYLSHQLCRLPERASVSAQSVVKPILQYTGQPMDVTSV